VKEPREEYLTVQQLATRLQVSTQAIYRGIRAGRISDPRLGVRGKCHFCNRVLSGRQRKWCTNECQVKAYLRSARGIEYKRDASRGLYYKRLAMARKRAAKMGCAILPVSRETVRAKFEYWGNRCWICGASGQMTLDHVKPFSRGGPHMLANIRPACRSCNARKSGKWLGVDALDALRPLDG